MPTSMNALPSMVNIRNFIAEYSRLLLGSLPQMAMRKNIGIKLEFPEEEEEQEVEGGEDAHDAGLEGEQPDEILADAELNVPRGKDGD